MSVLQALNKDFVKRCKNWINNDELEKVEKESKGVVTSLVNFFNDQERLEKEQSSASQSQQCEDEDETRCVREEDPPETMIPDFVAEGKDKHSQQKENAETNQKKNEKETQ